MSVRHTLYRIHCPTVLMCGFVCAAQIRLFISYDNATKQLDTVFDITPGLAQALLERINLSGFDMRNTSTIYRQGCFAFSFMSVYGWNN